MNRMKKWWILVIAAVVISFLLEIIQVNTQPLTSYPVTNDEIRKSETTIFPNKVGELYGYEFTGEELVTVQGDPQIHFWVDDIESFSYVYFYFNSFTLSDLRIQVFYPGEIGYTEENSTISTCPAGVDFWCVRIPEAHYNTLRIDIDGVPIPVTTISAGTIPAGRVREQGRIHPLRIVIVSVALFIIFFWMTWCSTWEKVRTLLSGVVKEIRKEKKKSVIFALAFLVGIGIAILLFFLFCTVFNDKSMTAPRFVFAGFVGFFSVSLFVFRKTLKTQPEYLFLILVLCVGFLYCYYVPHTGLNSWDEDYHYYQALKTSYVDSVVMTPQDEITISRNIPASYDLNGGVQAIHDRQDLMYQDGGTDRTTFAFPAGMVEVFNGIGLFIGRALGLRYYMIHFMGRFVGLITYAFLGFFGIRKLKSGKMITAAALMIPTTLFMASSYNYDCYLIGFTALGLCYYVSQWQNRAEKITLKDLIIIVGATAIGCLAKPVYIPFLWIYILLPRDKFPNRKSHIWFIISMAIVSFLVMISYFLPTLVQGGGVVVYGDTRAGSDISAAGQISYILSHPLQFINVMWNYMVYVYFDLNQLGQMFTNFPYLGIMPNQYLYLLLLIVVAFTDKNEYDKALVRHPWAHIWPILVSISLVMIAEASMYIVFTPVGATWVAGAQYRYLLPMILPVLLHIGSGMVDNKMDRGWYNGLVLSVAAFVNFACVYNAYISRYY